MTGEQVSWRPALFLHRFYRQSSQRHTCFLRASSSSSRLFLSSSCCLRRISSCCLRSSSCLFRSSSSRFALISASLLSCSSWGYTRVLLETWSQTQEHATSWPVLSGAGPCRHDHSLSYVWSNQGMRALRALWALRSQDQWSFTLFSTECSCLCSATHASAPHYDYTTSPTCREGSWPNSNTRGSWVGISLFIPTKDFLIEDLTVCLTKFQLKCHKSC